jgi:hypothetical protein
LLNTPLRSNNCLPMGIRVFCKFCLFQGHFAPQV